MKRQYLILVGAIVVAFSVGVFVGAFGLQVRKRPVPSFEELAGPGPSAEEYARAEAIFEERLWRRARLESLDNQNRSLDVIGAELSRWNDEGEADRWNWLLHSSSRERHIKEDSLRQWQGTMRTQQEKEDQYRGQLLDRMAGIEGDLDEISRR